MKKLITASLKMIDNERQRQETLREQRNWGPLEEEDYHVLNTVFGEEVGEVAKAVLELERTSRANVYTRKQRLRELRDEAIQSAAVASQIAEKAMHELFELDLLTTGSDS